MPIARNDAAVRKPGRPLDPQRRAEREGEILKLAATYFAEKGYAASDMQQLAERLGVAKGTIFHYFPTKRQLFQATINRALEQLRSWIDQQVESIADPLDKLKGATRAYLEFFQRRPEVVELLILERAEFKDRKSSYFEYRDRNEDGRWHQLLESLIDAGRLRRVPVERIMNVMGDLLYGVMFTNHMSGNKRPFQEQADDVLDIVLHGLLANRGS